MAITPAPGYIVDPNNPNAVIKAPTTAMPGSYAAIQQQASQPSIAFGAVNTRPVPVSTLTSTATPYTPPPAPPMPQVQPIVTGAIAGATTPPPVITPTPTPTPTDTMSFSERLKAMLGSDVNTFLSKPTSLAEQRTALRGEYDIAGKEKAVNDLSAQLASITAKYQTAPLILEQQAEGRGITTDVLNRQQAQAQRNYAIEALPVTAALNAAQGRLDSANRNITDLLGVIKEDQDSTYQYQKDVFARAIDIASEDQKRELEARSAQLDARKAQQEQFIKSRDNFINKAIEEGDYNAAGRIATAATFDEVASIFGTVPVTTDTQYIEVGGRKLLVDKKGNVLKDMGGTSTGGGTGTNNQLTDNERALMSQFRGEQIVKDYNTILSQKGTIDNYIQNGVGGPADIALVFSFMKGLDPNSVVRESEYATAAKSGNIFQGAFAKFNGYFKEKGGILPDNVKAEFQNLVNLKLKTQENLYNNVVKSYKGIAERQGLNPNNVVIDYAQANTAQPVQQTMSLDEAYAEYQKTLNASAPQPVSTTQKTTTPSYTSMLPDMSGYKGFSLGSIFKF